MGEVSKILSKGFVSKDTNLTIELNHPASESSKETIHIQSHDFRYELTPKEFRLLSSAILSSFDKLNSYKKK